MPNSSDTPESPTAVETELARLEREKGVGDDRGGDG